MQNLFKRHPILIGLATVFVLSAGDSSCSGNVAQTTAAQMEQRQQNYQYEQIIRNQPPPSFDYSPERQMLIRMYIARQQHVATYSYVQSEYSGKVLWSCPSIGYPVPYATQLTNPDQVQWRGYDTHYTSAVIPQQEPNGLFPPSSAEGTWVPCVNAKGELTPVYEERRVTTFLQPMQEKDGTLSPVPGGKPSLTIKTRQP